MNTLRYRYIFVGELAVTTTNLSNDEAFIALAQACR
jgi:hypothetical protein